MEDVDIQTSRKAPQASANKDTAVVGMTDLSARGRFNTIEIIARILKAILEGVKDPKSTNSLNNTIDLSMAENWLIRPEVLEICKAAINDNFDQHV